MKVPVKVNGKATIEFPGGLSKEERQAAEDMAEMVATSLLMSINSHKIADQNLN